MNELEKLMIAESKKKAIDDKLIKDEQQCEDDKYDNWEMETMDKLRFLENYNFVTLKRNAHVGHSLSIQRNMEQLKLLWLMGMRISQEREEVFTDTIPSSLSLSIGITE